MDISVRFENAGRFNYRTAVVVIHKGRILLHKPVEESYWALPGGRVTLMETSSDAAVREMQEELHVDVNIDRLLWITENFFTYNQESSHEIGFYYKASLKDTKQIPLGKDPFHGHEGERILLYQWYPVNKLDDITIKPLFLKNGLQQLPKSIQHVIIQDR